MKRKLAIVLAVVLVFTALVTLLVACDPSSSSGGGDAVVFYYYSMTRDLDNELKAKLQAFTEETGIKVKPNPIAKDNYGTSVTTQLSGRKNTIDVMYLDQPSLAQYASPGYILKLDDYVTSASSDESTVTASNSVGFAFNKDAFIDSAWQTTQYNGSTYAIPLTLNTSVLFYNVATIMEATGMSREDAIAAVESITTWAELKNFAENVVDGIGTKYALFGGLSSGGYTGWYSQVFVAAAGGKMYDEATKTVLPDTNGEVTRAFSMINYLYEKSPKNLRSGDKAFVGADGESAGTILFNLADSSSINDLKERTYSEFRAIRVPGETTTIGSVSNIGGENLVISARSDKKEQSLKLIQYLVSGECMPLFEKCTNNFAAVTKYATVDVFANLESNASVRAMVEQMYTVVKLQLNTAQVRPIVVGWMSINDYVIPPALLNFVDPASESDRIHSIEEVLAEIRSKAANYLK